MSPRPILKRSHAAYGAPSGSQHLAVHFPPSPSLTTHTFTAYSSSAYDRSPIEVSPNSCALPERGCPGRTYTLDEQCLSTQPKRGHYYGGRVLHPRAIALNAARQQQLEDAGRSPCSYPFPPPLIPDLSSESDESDGFSSPPDSYTPTNHVLGLAIPQGRYPTCTSFDVDPYGLSPISPSALSFLPHPPSSPSRSSYRDIYECDEPPTTYPKRRRERKHDPSRVPDRIPDAPASPSYRTPTKSRSRVSTFTKSLSPCHAVSSFRAEDDGCLGGF